MRAAAVLLMFGLGGCSVSDPDWSKPCDEQRAPSIEIGTGASGYLPIGSLGLPIEVNNATTGTTGTFVYVGVSLQGLGPAVTVTYGLTDMATGDALTTSASQSVQLVYDQGSDRDEAAGLVADLVDPNQAVDLVDAGVSVWADAVGCGRTVKGSTTSTIDGFDVTLCQGCVDQACLPQVAACGADCVALQACLDARCVNLSAQASPDEVTCQAYCESLHPVGREALVALASCVQAATSCQPPCNGYSIDYDACVSWATTTGGVCATALAACTASTDCQTYKTCVSNCTTWANGCEACGTASPAGEALYESYENCVEGACLVLGWLPHI
jgi:hypothetical protein